ncbi:RNA-binding domain-containing protein [Pyrenochaeta sp. DS3sAY3a]|nr:RNA-binding domain-containing protein [Pyrenochaeta sp. DS3sAY3a]
MASWNNNPAQHSLPARPPPSTYSAPPQRAANAFGSGQPSSSAYGGYAAAAPYTPPTNYPPPTVSAPYQASAYPTSNAYSDYSYPAYAQGAPAPTFPTAAPTNHGPTSTFDAEEEARIAEWHSAYSRDDAKKPGGAVGGTREGTSTPAADGALQADGKRKTVVRDAGGKKWEDPSLLEWDPHHPRLFIGNLAGEVTDESLHKAFSKYPSLSKARVVRDKRSTKSKSYGFVSFSDTDDYFRAAKEMQGKYIGSHPVLVKRANTEMKVVTKRDNPQNKYSKNNKNNKNKGDKAATNSATPPVSSTAMFVPRGVQKKGKTNTLKLLG